VLEPGLIGLVEREVFEADERRDAVRPSPVLPVRVCPKAGRTVTGGGCYCNVSVLPIHLSTDIHCFVVQVDWWNESHSRLLFEVGDYGQDLHLKCVYVPLSVSR
jgi:hypothetical protein